MGGTTTGDTKRKCYKLLRAVDSNIDRQHLSLDFSLYHKFPFDNLVIYRLTFL